MNKLRIALISDLHVGTGARALDMCPHSLPDDEKVGKNPDYLGVFEANANSGVFSEGGTVDMLCITGDISNRAHPEEFRYASNAILRVAKALGVSEGEIFFVPGNHDVHWPVMKVEPPLFWERSRYLPFLQDGLLFSKRLREIDTGALQDSPYFVVWDTPKHLVVAINSAAYDGPANQPHHGEIRQASLDSLSSRLARSPINSEQLRLCLLHHHPIQYSEPIPDLADHSIIVNSENFLDVMMREKFDLILHGHKHHPRLQMHQLDNRNPFVSLCAGSFSATLQQLHTGSIANLFHVINVDGRDDVTYGIKGSVETWSYRPEGKWLASHQLLGMHPKEAFGLHASEAEIIRRIRATLDPLAGRGENCHWRQLVEADPQLEYIRKDAAFQAFSKASETVGYEFVGDKGSNNENWVAFLRR